MPQPTKGRIVMVHTREKFNGSHEHPAIITAVHSADLINVKAFVDAPDDVWLTSVKYWGEHSWVPEDGDAWFWPPIVHPEPQRGTSVPQPAGRVPTPPTDPHLSFGQTAPDIVRTDPPSEQPDVGNAERTVPRYPEAANPAD